MAHHNTFKKIGALQLALVLFTTAAAADPRLYDKVHKKDAVAIVLPDGECDAKVVKRALDQLTLKLSETTQVCGPRDSLITVSRMDVKDIVPETLSRYRGDPGFSAARACTLIVGVAAAVTAGQYVGEKVGDGAGLAVAGGGLIGGAVLCHAVFSPRGARYSVFTYRIAPAQP